MSTCPRVEIDCSLPGAYVTPDRPGCKRVPITLVVYMTAVVPEDWDEDAQRFFVEENHCLNNLVEELARANAADPKHCTLCSHADAYLGVRQVVQP
jgi:hypothetical protein